MTTVWNPGEPVFDQETGEPVIDPSTGDAVIVEPGGRWTNPATGVVYQADDVVNACWFRVNHHVGEVLRNQADGIDFENVIFGMPVVDELIAAEFKATALTTPGIGSITEARRFLYDANTRSVAWLFRARKRDGSQLPAAVTMTA